MNSPQFRCGFGSESALLLAARSVHRPSPWMPPSSRLVKRRCLARGGDWKRLPQCDGFLFACSNPSGHKKAAKISHHDLAVALAWELRRFGKSTRVAPSLIPSLLKRDEIWLNRYRALAL